MKIKDCTHPEPRTLSPDNRYCPACGALETLGNWQAPAALSDLRRWLIAEPTDLPVHSERRAWEGFAAANLPFASSVIAAEAESEAAAAHWTPDERIAMANALAGRMADRMLGDEWAKRFAPNAELEGG